MRDMGLEKKNWGFFHVTQRMAHVSVKNDNLIFLLGEQHLFVHQT